MKSRQQNFTVSAVILIVAVLLLSGCATGKGVLEPKFSYGNPDYEHVSELPQNQTAVWEANQPAAPKLPEMTADEFEARGDALLKKKHYGLAYLDYTKSLMKRPDSERVEYKIGMTYLMAGKLDDALGQFQKLSEKNSANGATWESMGRVLFLKRDYKAAEKYFLKALETDIGLWESHNFLGYIYDTRKSHTQAIRHYICALSIMPTNGMLYNNLGVSYSSSGRFAEAIEAFQAALAKGYSNPKLYNNLGLALARRGEFDAALEAFEKGGDEPTAYNNLGSIHLRAERYEAAIRCFQTAMERDPRFNVRASENLKLARVQRLHSENQR